MGNPKIDKAKFSKVLLNHKMTRRDFCEKTGMNPFSLSKKLNGHSKFSYDDLLSIRNNTGITKGEFEDLFFCKSESK